MISAWLFATLGVQARSETVSFDVDGQTRSAIVFKPSSSRSGKPAVYFVFHGLGGSAAEAVLQFHIQKLDPQAIVIYGDGIPPSLNETERRSSLGGRFPDRTKTWQIMPRQYEDRDIHFLQAMIEWADASGGDPSRRYLIGHSNGSGFAWVVLKKMGGEFSRFVGMNGDTLLPLRWSARRPIFLTSGTQDKLVSALSVSAFAEKLANYNGCGAGSGSPVKTFPGANPVYLYEYNGGHMPPPDAYTMAVKFCQTGKPN